MQLRLLLALVNSLNGVVEGGERRTKTKLKRKKVVAKSSRFVVVVEVWSKNR